MQNNFIGLDASGAIKANNRGIFITSNSTGNLIGAMQNGPGGNVISGNIDDGVLMLEANSNTIRSNYIGLNPTGNEQRDNGGNGITIIFGHDNLVEENYIAGNSRNGIVITGESSISNTIYGNRIGTNSLGTARVPNGHNGVRVTGAHDNIVEQNLLSGNNLYGLLIDDGAARTMVRGNTIGTDPLGIVSLFNNKSGIGIDNSSNNVIGDWVDFNLISGNKENGIEIVGQDSKWNRIDGNRIGTNWAATQPLDAANPARVEQIAGVYIHNLATENTVGNPFVPALAGLPSNVISGNFDGIEIVEADKNYVFANFIGTDLSGTQQAKNSYDGIRITNSKDNVIGMVGLPLVGGVVGGLPGGSVVAPLLETMFSSGLSSMQPGANLVSGNGWYGISIQGDRATNNRIAGNYIGTDISGTHALGNRTGVFINNAGGTIISHNIIAGNFSPPDPLIEGGYGIWISGTATNSTISGNYIGLGRDNSAIGNGSDGIRIAAGTSGGHKIGTDEAFGRNYVCFNGGKGVVIKDAANTSTIDYNNIGIDPNFGEAVNWLGAIEAAPGQIGTNNNVH